MAGTLLPSRTFECQLGLAAVAFAFGLVACGGKFDSQGNGPGGSANGGSGATSGGGSPGQSASGARAGSGSQGALSGASARGSPAGSATPGGSGSQLTPDGGARLAPDGGDAQDAGTLRGCGLGTSCLPGNDLAPPAPIDGYQIVTPPGMFTVQPGQESYPNYCATLPNTAEFDVGTIQSWMTAGSSHDLVVYQASPGAAPSGSACSPGASTWMYASSIAGQIVELKMPDGVGLPLQASTSIVLTMHFVNAGTSPIEPQVKLNLLRAHALQYKAAAMVAFNTAINIPAATATGPGTQTVTGTCTAPAGSNFFLVGTETHSLAKAADVNLVTSGGTTTNVVHTTNWQYPDVGVWSAPPFLTVHNGDSITYSCAYSNSGTTNVTVGETQSNETCMAVGYYFPAGNASCH